MPGREGKSRGYNIEYTIDIHVLIHCACKCTLFIGQQNHIHIHIHIHVHVHPVVLTRGSMWSTVPGIICLCLRLVSPSMLAVSM